MDPDVIPALIIVRVPTDLGMCAFEVLRSRLSPDVVRSRRAAEMAAETFGGFLALRYDDGTWSAPGDFDAAPLAAPITEHV